jgi:3-oxoacyl-[acyl-carrier protein] reductase
MSPGRFEGKGLVITEGCRGIGPAAVIATAREGANVVFSGCSADQGAAGEILSVARSVGIAERVSFVVSDVSSEADVERLFDIAFERLPALHVLINNVQTEAAPTVTPLVEISFADWNKVLAAHLREPFLLSRRVIQEFLGGGEGGRIVHVISVAAGGPALSASYAASQSALRAFTRSIVKEYGPRGIACNTLIIRGGLQARTVSPHSVERRTGDAFPVRCFLDHSKSVLEALLFLASDESSFVSGEVLYVADSVREEKGEIDDPTL